MCNMRNGGAFTVTVSLIINAKEQAQLMVYLRCHSARCGISVYETQCSVVLNVYEK